MMEVSKKAVLFSLKQGKELFFDSSEEEDEFLCSYFSSKSKRKRCNVKKRNCIENYVEITVPKYTPDDFKKHFRLRKSTFQVLLNLLQPKLVRETGRRPVDSRKKLLSVVWLLAKLETFTSVADRFDLSTSMLHDYLTKICSVLAEMAATFIYWPPDLQEIERDFQNICGFPGVIGAIDGSHIQIKAPNEQPEKYFNRKKFYSLILQAVALRNLTFTHVTCSYPGSVHDARVFANSDIPTWYGNINYFHDHCHLIGDAAYPLSMNLMVPYKDNGHLGRRQINFNMKLSQSRVCVERAFGLLKSRFRRLKMFDAKVKHIPLYVLACCILHNICIKENDFVDIDDLDESQDEGDTDEDVDDQNASNKRDYICGLL